MVWVNFVPKKTLRLTLTQVLVGQLRTCIGIGDRLIGIAGGFWRTGWGRPREPPLLTV